MLPFCLVMIEVFMGLPRWLSGKRIYLQETQEMQIQSLGQEDILEEEMATNSAFLPGNSHEQRSLVGCSPWDLKRIGHN